MISFRNSAALALALLSSSAIAAPKPDVPANAIASPAPPAAVGQVRPAAPPKAAGDTSAPAQAAPAPTTPPPLPSPTSPVPESVQSQPLAIPEGQLMGVLDSQSGGFSRDLWQGSDRALIETLLPRLPAAQGSPAMTELERRLLLSRADPPQGNSRQKSIAAARLDRALALGQLATIEPLAQQLQGEGGQPDVLGPRVDALLYQSKDQDACSLAENARGRATDSAWTKRLALCDALGGKAAQARLSVDVLADSGDSDPAFGVLMGHLVDKAKAASVNPDNPSPVHFALLRKTGGSLAEAALEHASPAFLVAWANYEKAPIAQRVAAGERATASGAMPAAALVKLYEALPLKPGRLTTKFGAKTPVAGIEGAAYAVRRAAATTDGNERARLIIAAFKAARDRGVLPALAAVFKADVAGLAIGDTTLDQAAALGTVEALSGGKSARRWLDLARSKGESEPAVALQSLLSARGVTEADWTSDQMVARLRGAKGADQARAVYEWSVLRPLGLQQNAAVYFALADGPLTAAGAVPPTNVLEGLQDASEHGRVGETAMFALLALGAAGPRGAHPFTAAAIVHALAKVGLTADARAIATEALAWRMP